MGWRNTAFSALDDAEQSLRTAREALNARKPEDFVRALLLACEACHHGMGLAVDDGLPSLVSPKNDG